MCVCSRRSQPAHLKVCVCVCVCVCLCFYLSFIRSDGVDPTSLLFSNPGRSGGPAASLRGASPFACRNPVLS
jgi:hypothetical protein